ncbi:glycerate 2-kinase [Reticulomyxa filosa]|uniref:Glycerate 2-kinase n=1 Tax=Reticulomyxa filosa TaxID=46433 RepID=X6MTJ0_RETFI|nr:glycerate 2-kinase [Reticulomyxa filosa]|eukprot:ETO16961.1 glycerate 2-kinase [Reticulomyxa filosa]
MALKIVVAPNAFKECLSAAKAANAMLRGVQKAFTKYKIEAHAIPLGDGEIFVAPFGLGDGTAEVLITTNHGKFVPVTVQDPIGRDISCKYGIFQSRSDNVETAVIEMAECSGLWRLNEKEKNPMKTSTYGTGQMILHCVEHQKSVKRVILCIGGSATNDGGFGMANALGIQFLHSPFEKESNTTNGKLLSIFNGFPCPEQFLQKNVSSIDISSFQKLQQKLHDIEFIVACDVKNPLIGSYGASYVYGPQKLSTLLVPEKSDRDKVLERLDSALTSMNHMWKLQLSKDVSEIPGAGAAGGLGGGCMVYLNAQMRSGFDLVSEHTGLEESLKNADLVLTGEGRMDSSTDSGKVPHGVAELAKKHGVDVVFAVTGNCKKYSTYSSSTDEKHDPNMVAFAIADGPMDLQESLERSSELIENETFRICKVFEAGFSSKLKKDFIAQQNNKIMSQ